MKKQNEKTEIKTNFEVPVKKTYCMGSKQAAIACPNEQQKEGIDNYDMKDMTINSNHEGL